MTKAFPMEKFGEGKMVSTRRLDFSSPVLRPMEIVNCEGLFGYARAREE